MRQKILLVLILFLPCSIIYGQPNTHEEPVSIRTQVPTLSINEQTHKVLPSLDRMKIEQEDEEDEKNGKLPRFGFKHEVSYNLTNSGEWVEFPNGDKIWRLCISCPEAISINLLYDRFWMPEGAKFFIYSNDYQHHLGAFTSEDNEEEDVGGFATGLIHGDKIILEYYLPKGVEEPGNISISHVVHGYRFFGSSDNSRCYGFGCSNGTHTNVNCSSAATWQKEKNAVVRIAVDGYRYGTGALVNTTENGDKFLLTANHCLTDEYGHYLNPSNFLFYWHYESPVCQNPTNEPPLIYTRGAKVAAKSHYGDFALLELSKNPADEWDVMPYYLGWDRSGNVQTGAVVIHHPRGDIKKILGVNKTIEEQSKLYYVCDHYSSISLPTHWHFYSNTNAIVESGSSGAPFLNSNRKLIGQHTSIKRMGNQHGTYYEVEFGKFSWAWDGYCHPNATTRLKDWLDPNNTGAITMDGRGCQKTIRLWHSYPQSAYHAVQNIISRQKIESGNVSYKAGSEIRLEDGFHAKSGTNFRASIEELAECSSAKSMSSSSQGNEQNNDNTIEDNYSLLPQNQILYKVNLLPNPNSGTFQIEPNFPLTDIGNFKVINLLGVPVYESQYLTSTIIQLPNSATGQYFVVIILKDGSVLTQKVMVQR